MRYRNFLTPLFGLCVAGSASAHTPRPSTPPSPVPSSTAPVQPVNPPVTPAVPASAAVTGSATWFRDRLGTMLSGIALDATQRQRIDSVLTANSVMLSSSASDSIVGAAARERIMGMVGPIDAAVRVILSAPQQVVWDRNIVAWRERERNPASN